MLFERFGVIDVDTHITEPPDTWLGRMPSKWGDAIPHIERVEGFDTWVIDGKPYAKPGNTAMAGFDGTLPQGPATYEDMHPAAWDPEARIAFMDEQHIRAQVLYPNLGGFGAGAWLDKGEPAYALDCVRAYNDFQTDFASIAPERLLPITSLPFWDVEATVVEIERCVAKGHRGVNFCNQPQTYDQPPLWDRHWDRIWSAALESGVTVNFHIGGGRIGELIAEGLDMGFRANFSRMSAMLFSEPALHRRSHPRRRLPPLPRPQVRVGGERRRHDPGSARGDGLAMAQRRRRHRAPRVRPPAVGVLPAPDLRLLLVRAPGRHPRAPGLPGQHAVRVRLPP
ncbi:MAG: amidohydrolase family protein, partial [Acidimicrobiales bacterium]